MLFSIWAIEENRCKERQQALLICLLSYKSIQCYGLFRINLSKLIKYQSRYKFRVEIG